MRVLPKKNSIKIYAAGFTLIELLVTFTLIAMVSGVGFASFVSYSRRQSVVQASADIKKAVDLGRFNAISQIKPSICGDDPLTSYRVIFCLNGLCQTQNADIEVSAVCATTPHVVHTEDLQDDISLENVSGSGDCDTITFGGLGSSVSGAPCQVRVSGFGNESIVSVQANGYVTY